MRKPSKKEQIFIRDYLELPYLIVVLDLNIKKLQAAKFKLGGVFKLQMLEIQDKIFAEQKEINQYFRKNGIQVYEQIKSDHMLEAKYVVRGYHSKIQLLWTKVQNDIEIKLAEYMDVDLSKLVRDE